MGLSVCNTWNNMAPMSESLEQVEGDATIHASFVLILHMVISVVGPIFCSVLLIDGI